MINVISITFSNIAKNKSVCYTKAGGMFLFHTHVVIKYRQKVHMHKFVSVCVCGCVCVCIYHDIQS